MCGFSGFWFLLFLIAVVVILFYWVFMLLPLLVTASANFAGYCEVEWVDRWNGGASAVCAFGWGSPEWK